MIVDNFEKRDLEPGIAGLIDTISENMDTIKRDIMNNDSRLLESLINHY